MSSRYSSPGEEADELDDIRMAMASSSPVRPTAKRRRVEDDSSDTEESNVPSTTVDPNDMEAVKRFITFRKLRAEQATDVEGFLNDPPAVREGKIYVTLIALQNQINNIVVKTPPFEISTDLEKNLVSYAGAVLLSRGVSSYKGKIVTALVLDVTFKYGHELPAGIKHNPAALAKIVAAASDALTQKRSKFKKLLGASVYIVNVKKRVLMPKEDQQDIFALSRAFVDGSNSNISVPLCCRIALMRRVFLKFPGNDFWDKLDNRLASIRSDAKGSASLLVKAFKYILEQDQLKHGPSNADSTDLSEDVDDLQKSIDDVIQAASMSTASSVVIPLSVVPLPVVPAPVVPAPVPAVSDIANAT